MHCAQKGCEVNPSSITGTWLGALSERILAGGVQSWPVPSTADSEDVNTFTSYVSEYQVMMYRQATGGEWDMTEPHKLQNSVY